MVYRNMPMLYYSSVGLRHKNTIVQYSTVSLLVSVRDEDDLHTMHFDWGLPIEAKD